MAKKNEMGLSKYPYNSTNPFIGGVVESITTSKTRRVAGFKFQDVVNSETGEVDKQTMMVLGTRKEVDTAEFAKLYRSNFVRFYGLSKAALDILDFITDNIQYNSDKICLYIPDIMAQKGISYSTSYRSIAQLIESKLLAKADMSGCYYINPQIFFKGDRIVLINEFVKKEVKESTKKIKPKP